MGGVNMAKKKTQTKKTTKTVKEDSAQVKSQEVPPRPEGQEPKIIRKMDPAQAAAIEAEQSFSDVKVLQYAYNRLQQMALETEYTAKPVPLYYHDLEFFMRIALFALRRTVVANDRLEKLKTLVREETSSNEEQ